MIFGLAAVLSASAFAAQPDAGQLANKNLDSSEKFMLGGPSGVRAYPIGEGAGFLRVLRGSTSMIKPLA